MTERSAKLIFWIGTLASAAVFLALTWDTHRSFDALTHADRLDENVVAGKRAFEKYNCNDCHTMLGFGGYYAPDLTRAYLRMGEDSIRRRLEHPEQALVASYRKMPQQRLASAEVDRIVDFLRWTSGIENNDWPPQDSESRWSRATRRVMASAAVSPGAALVLSEGCTACHPLGNQGERRGPRLEWIGSRRDAAYIARYIADPDAVSPGSVMPGFDRLSESQRRAIAEFVTSLGDARGSTP